MKTKIIFLLMCVVIVLLSFPVSAHSGGTDSQGGHYDHSTGEYHYHHGYSAHSHYDIDGDGLPDCPYRIQKTTNKKTQLTKWKINDTHIILIPLIFLSPLIYGFLYLLFDSIAEKFLKKQNISDIVISRITVLIVILLLIGITVAIGFLP